MDMPFSMLMKSLPVGGMIVPMAGPHGTRRPLAGDAWGRAP
jgi:hypothetical protein